MLAAVGPEAVAADTSAADKLSVVFDNESDPDSTIITISGRDRADLLMSLTGGFSALDLRVVAANIKSSDDGRVLDDFRVTGLDDKKVGGGF